MVAFAPTVASPNIGATADPEYTSYRWSRPISPFEGNKSQEIALKGFGGALEEGAKDINQGIKTELGQSIDKTAGDIVNKREAFLQNTLASLQGGAGQGVTGTETDGADKMNILTKPTDKPTVPKDIKSLGPTLDAMNERKANGAISPTKYLGDLDTLAKQYRSMFPTYTKEIDAEFERVSERGSANKYIQSMTADINSYVQAAKEARGKTESLLEHAQTVDHIPGSDIWAAQFHAGKLTGDQVGHLYNLAMRDTYNAKQAETHWQQMDAEAKTSNLAATKALNHEVANVIQNSFRTVDAASDFSKVQDDAVKNNIDPAHAEMLANHYQAIRTQAVSAALAAAANVKNARGKAMIEDLGNPEEIQKIINENPQIQMLDNTIKLLVGGENHSTAVLADNVHKGAVAQDALNLYNDKGPLGAITRSWDAINKAGLKDTAVGTYLATTSMKDPKLMSATEQWFQHMSIVGAAQPDMPEKVYTMKQAYDKALATDGSKPEEFRSFFKTITDGIADPSAPLQVKVGYSDMAYDTENLQLLEKVAPDGKDPVSGKPIPGQTWFYQQLTSKDKAQQVASTAMAAGRPDLWDKYVNYTNAAGAFVASGALGELANMQKNPYLTVTYDTDKHQFKIQHQQVGFPSRPGVMDFYNDFRNSMGEQQADAQIAKINTVLHSISILAAADPRHPQPDEFIAHQLIAMAPDGSISEAMLQSLLASVKPPEKSDASGNK